MSSFRKYELKGAYHWVESSDNILEMNAFVKARYQLVINAMKAAGASGGCAVLDAGCGDGALSGLIFREYGAMVRGVDVETAAIALARSMFEKKGCEGEFSLVNGYEYPFADATFDFAVCADVIEHVENPVAMLREIKRALKPGGACIVTTPLRSAMTPKSKEHLREWFAEEFEELCGGVFGPPAARVHSHPLFWFEMYQRKYTSGGFWKIPFYMINLTAKWGRNVFLESSGAWEQYSLQTLTLRKESGPVQESGKS